MNVKLNDLVAVSFAGFNDLVGYVKNIKNNEAVVETEWGYMTIPLSRMRLLMSGWRAVDLDGTLAVYDTWMGYDQIGEPIQKMVDEVKELIAQGEDVRIFTARVWPLGTIESLQFEYKERVFEATKAKEAIEKWCVEHIGIKLPVTCIKDYSMIDLRDDRAIEIVRNTGYSLKEYLEMKGDLVCSK